MNLEVDIGGMIWKNPVSVMSGTGGYGEEITAFYALSELGAFFTKCITLEPRAGNPPPRVWETSAGMLNAIGLQNVGLEIFVKEKLPMLRESGTNIIVNISGRTIDEYAQLAEKLSLEAGVSGIELNVSCPNVKRGGMEFGRDPDILCELVSMVRRSALVPMIVKLSPNVTDIAELAVAAQDAGADALTLINTIHGMAIDIETRKPRLRNIYGGLSGPAIKPVALRMVHQAARAVSIPIIGVGGIMTGLDAVEFFLAGASAVGVGTAALIDPMAPVRIRDEIKTYMDSNGIEDIRQIIGGVRDWEDKPDD